MLSIDPRDDPGSFLPREPPPVPVEGVPDDENRQAGHVVTPQPLEDPVQPLKDIVPLQAMANGGTIIRPGAVAWDGTGNRSGHRFSSCEAIERALAAVSANPAKLSGLLTELADTRLWVPLPDRRRPFTDGAAVQLPVIGYEGSEFVPCFTSVQRLTAWADQPGAQRAGDARAELSVTEPSMTVPHVVVPAAGLAGRLPAGVGLALNPDTVPGLPLYPECVPYLARLTPPGSEAPGAAPGQLAMEHLLPGTEAGLLIGHPPAEPTALLAAVRAALGTLPAVSAASRAWLSVPGHGAGLVIAVGLDDPASHECRAAVVDAIDRAAATVALHVPFTLDVTFTGEPAPDAQDPEARAPDTLAPDAIDAWIARNTRPFYVRAGPAQETADNSQP
jgi:hypothetical protein